MQSAGSAQHSYKTTNMLLLWARHSVTEKRDAQTLNETYSLWCTGVRNFMLTCLVTASPREYPPETLNSRTLTSSGDPNETATIWTFHMLPTREGHRNRGWTLQVITRRKRSHPGMNFQVHDIHPQFCNRILQRIREQTTSEPSSIIHSGWPSTIQQVEVSLTFLDELAVEDGIAMKRYRIIIPSVLQKEILTKLHAAHQGTEKQSSRPRQAFREGVLLCCRINLSVNVFGCPS